MRNQRGGEEVWLSASCRKTGEMLLGLIRVNEAMKTERFPSMGKVKVQELKWRSEGGRAWVERAGEVMAVRFGHSNACTSAK